MKAYIRDIICSDQSPDEKLERIWEIIPTSDYSSDHLDIYACPKCNSRRIAKHAHIFFMDDSAFSRYKCLSCNWEEDYNE